MKDFVEKKKRNGQKIKIFMDNAQVKDLIINEVFIQFYNSILDT